MRWGGVTVLEARAALKADIEGAARTLRTLLP